MIAYDIGAIYGSPTAGEKTVLKYWKDFTAGWRRHASLIPPETTQSVINVGTPVASATHALSIEAKQSAVHQDPPA